MELFGSSTEVHIWAAMGMRKKYTDIWAAFDSLSLCYLTLTLEICFPPPRFTNTDAYFCDLHRSTETSTDAYFCDLHRSTEIVYLTIY